MATSLAIRRAERANRARALFEERFCPLAAALEEARALPPPCCAFDGAGLIFLVLSHCVDLPVGARFTRRALARSRSVALDALMAVLTVASVQPTVLATEPTRVLSDREVRRALEQWYQSHARFLQRVVDCWADAVGPGLDAWARGQAPDEDELARARAQFQLALGQRVPDRRLQILGAIYAHRRLVLMDRLGLSGSVAPATRALDLTGGRDHDDVDEATLLNAALAEGMGPYLVARADGGVELYQLGLTDRARELRGWSRRTRADGNQHWGPAAGQLPSDYDIAASGVDPTVGAAHSEVRRDLDALLDRVIGEAGGGAAWEAARKFVRANAPGTRAETYAEVAEEFGTTVARVRSRVAKLREAILADLERHVPPGKGPRPSRES